MSGLMSLMKMLYEKEYEESGKNKDAFIKIMAERYPNIKIKTIKNNWYMLNKKKDIIVFAVSEETTHRTKRPNMMKLMLFEDIRKFNPNYTKEYLFKYGFSYKDIEWLEEKYGKIKK